MGMDRGTFKKVEKGTASLTSVRAVEAWLTAQEEKAGSDFEEAAERGLPEVIEFVMTGDPGMTFTVKGPVSDRAELEESFLRIVERLRGPKE